MVGSTAASDEPEAREVILDRPFVYFTIDNMTLTPLFAGAMTNMALDIRKGGLIRIGRKAKITCRSEVLCNWDTTSGAKSRYEASFGKV